MIQKKVITIQDLSCMGRCSGSVALPVLCALGVETALVPTGIFSTHTGGFTNPYKIDLTDHLSGILKHWKKEGLGADALYAGYLASVTQIDLVEQYCRELHNLPLYLDPVMGDNGRLYSGFDEEYVKKMQKLVEKAAVIFPNTTEAAKLLGLPYKEFLETGEIEKILGGLRNLGAEQVFLTGIKRREDKDRKNQTIWNCYKDREKELWTEHTKIEGHFHGTGDLFASVVTGGLVQGMDVSMAEGLADLFIRSAIEKTKSMHGESREGLRFELCLSLLTDFVRKEQEK